MESRLLSEIETLTLQKIIAYSERNKLVAVLAHIICRMEPNNSHKCFIAKHKGGQWEDDWRNVVVFDLPCGQVTWHIHDGELPLFFGLEHRDDYVWDGHNTEEKYRRLLSYFIPMYPFKPTPQSSQN